MIDVAYLRAAYSHASVKAFYRVIREKESAQDDSAYTLVNLAAPNDPVRGIANHHFTRGFADHPYAGLSTVASDPSKRGYAAGAPQFIPSTWAEVKAKYGFADFSPANQDLGYVARLIYRGALEDVIAGRFDQAVAKCRPEWSSLPGASESSSSWTIDKARALYEQYLGGIRQPRPDVPSLPPTGGQRMGALAALQLFAPILSGLIPQLSGILKPESEVAKRNVALAETLVSTITQATSSPNLQAAVEKMQADPAVAKDVQKAIVTEPTVMAALQIVEVGGGAAGAREADAKAAQLEKPFWKASAVFWMSVLLIPLVYWLVGSLIVGGVTLPDDTPWWARMVIALFGSEWTGEARSGGFNLVIGLVLGGICGVYYGVSVTQQKQSASGATGKEA